VLITKQVVEPQPVLWQQLGNNNYNNLGGNQAGYQFGYYPSGYNVGVNHALIGLGVGNGGRVQGQGTGTNINSVTGNLMGTALSVMQGLMSPGGNIAGYAVGHNNYLGPRITGLTTNINK